MASARDASDFDAVLGCLFASDLDQLATQLFSVTGLAATEAEVLLDTLRDSLMALMHAKLSRLLIVELHAARLAGQLEGADGGARWDHFIALAARPEFWERQANHYRAMPARIRRIVQRRCAAALQFAKDFTADRAELDRLVGRPLGPLLGLSFGAGDSHDGGKTVALLRCAEGRLAYKPRSVRVDAELRSLVEQLDAWLPGGSSMKVARVLDRGRHGWAEFIVHRHAANAEELARFYRGVGHWLALMRLLSGSDLHAENLIAEGPHPVVVDCETLFTPQVPNPPSQLGAAAERAARLVSGSVLGVGLLPGRGQGLGWRGVDTSALGALPDQQPMSPQPAILKAGTDEAHIGMEMVAVEPAQNHPSPRPALAEHWHEVLSGFDELTDLLQGLDAEARLEPLLRPFADCQVRVVTRATEAYAELARMLWHPSSLHQEDAARARAEDLLLRMGSHVGMAPSDPEVVRAEVQDLMDGDVPLFSTRVSEGRLKGPGGLGWLPTQDLAAAALREWRAADFRLERHVIRAALVSAYINDGWMPAESSLRIDRPALERLEERRRGAAAAILRELLATAIRGADGSVAWIAPVLGASGWSVQPLDPDLYGGLSGLALLVAAYLREETAGRADPVEGLQSLLRDLLHTLELAEDKLLAEQGRGRKLRPQPPGGYVGLASQVWTWLALERLGAVDGRAVERACALAELLPEACKADEILDLLTGKAGAVLPLLQLAERSGQRRYLDMAIAIGEQLLALAKLKDGKAYWTHPHWPEGMGGFVHGSTGFAWVLSKLAQASGQARFEELAEAARAFEAALYDPEEGCWLDLRGLEGAKTAAAWCHGAVGIGLATLDLDPELQRPESREQLRRAAAATRRQGLGWNHSLCHGDASAHALLLRAAEAGLAPQGLSRESLLAEFLASLEAHGPICGIARDVFVPSLMPGLGGVAYQLLAFHPAAQLPDVLTQRL